MKKSLLVLGTILILSGPLILITGTVYTLMLPNIYASSARISVSEEAPSINPFADQQSGSSAYNPYFLRTQFEMIQSKPILYEVINRLDLQKKWGRDGEKLPLDVALKILKNSVSVLQQRDTSLIYISVKRDNPMEAAMIANEIAETYRDSRLDRADMKMRGMADKIQEALADQQARVDAAEKEVVELRAELGLPDDFGANADTDRMRLQQLQVKSLTAKSEMDYKERQLRIMEELENKPLIERAANTTFDQSVMTIFQQIHNVEAMVISLEENSGSTSSKLKSYQLQKKTLEKALAERLVVLKSTLESEYNLTKINYDRLDEQLRALDINSNREQFRPFKNAQAELESEQYIYNQLKAKFRQKVISLEDPRSPVQIIDIAEPNRRPVSPNLFMNVLLSLLLGTIPTVAGIILVAVGTARRNPPSIP